MQASAGLPPLGFLLLACASSTTGPLADPRPYRDSAPMHWTSERAASVVRFACRTPPFDPANGLDDDCDGRIDGEPTPSAEARAFAVVVAHPPSVNLRIRLEGPRGLVAATALRDTERCDAAAAVAIQRALYARLTPGHYTLALEGLDDCGSDLPVRAHVALAPQVLGDGGSGLSATVTKGKVTTVGTLDVP